MSKYTTEVRFICENAAGLTESKGYDDTASIIQAAIPKIFNFSFPLFDPAYKNVLCGKILRHYYAREIGAETVGLWKLWLETKLNEIMPYYNKLYESELLKFNPLYDVDLTTQHKGSGTDNSKQTENVASKNSGTQKDISETGSIDKYADTPQGAITDLLSDRYLTNARAIDEDGTLNRDWSDGGVRNTAGERVVNTTDEYLNHVYGKSPGKGYATLIKEYRDTFLNIDMMIIEDLSSLFFNLW